jgi:hypothetical protein
MGDRLTLVDFYSVGNHQTPWDRIEWPGADLDVINDFVQGNEVDWKISPLNIYDIKRRSNAGYLQADFRTSEEIKRLPGNTTRQC